VGAGSRRSHPLLAFFSFPPALDAEVAASPHRGAQRPFAASLTARGGRAGLGLVAAACSACPEGGGHEWGTPPTPRRGLLGSAGCSCPPGAFAPSMRLLWGCWREPGAAAQSLGGS